MAEAAGELTRKDHLIALKAQGDAARAELKALQEQVEGVSDAARRADSALADVDTSRAGEGFGKVADESGRAKSAMANMAGNVSGELGELAGAGGIAAQAIGELAEGAAEGELNLSILAKVAGPMAGLAVAMTVMNEAMNAANASRAFDADRVKRYTDAIEDGIDPVEAFTRHVEDLGKIEFRQQGGGGLLGLFSTTKDLLPVLAEADMKIEDFTKIVATFATKSTDEWRAALEAQGVTMLDAIAIVTAAKGEYEAWGNTVDGIAARTEVLGDRNKDLRDRLDEVGHAAEAAARLGEVWADVTDAAADAQRDAAFAAGDLRRAVEATDTALDNLKGALDMEEAILGFQSTIADALDLSDDVGPTQEQILAVKRSIIDLGETAGANPAVIKAQVESVTPENLMQVAGDVTRYYQNYPATMSITPTLNWSRLNLPAGQSPSRIPAGVPSMVGPDTGGGGGAPVVNVTQHIPRGWRGDALTSARQAARRSGGLYQRARR